MSIKHALFSHNHCDFDGFASMIAFSKLKPNSDIIYIINSTLESNLKIFLDSFEEFHYEVFENSNKDFLKNVLNNLNFILVDSFDLSFIEKFQLNPSDITIYDHHEAENFSIPNVKYHHKNTGSCVSFILNEIKDLENLHITYNEALLFVLGIYDDTGSLTYFNTTDIDRKIAKFFIETHHIQQAEIDFYLNIPLTNPQNIFYDLMLKCKQTYILGHIRVDFVPVNLKFNPGSFMSVVQKYQKEQYVDVVFFIIKRKNKTYIMARSKYQEIEVLDTIRDIGGGGHKFAAAAAVFKEELDSTLFDLKKIFFGKFNFEKTDDIKIKIVNKILEIAKENNMKIFAVGGIVRDFILQNKNFAKSNNFVLPIALDIDLATDEDAIFFGEKIKEKNNIFNKLGFDLKIRFNEKFKTINLGFEAIDWRQDELAERGQDKLAEHGLCPCSAGGATADFSPLAKNPLTSLEAKNPLTSSSFHIDIATLRGETYSQSGALPDVFKGDLKEDLKRRDISINAMAISLNDDDFGRFFDYYGGFEDLKIKTARILHDNSFVDDPTRILRVIRFASRFDLTIEKNTKKLLKDAENRELLKNISNDRFLNEFKIIFKEDLEIIKKSLKLLDEYGFLEMFFGRKVSYLNLEKHNNWIEYVCFLISNFEEEEKRVFIERFSFTRQEKKMLNNKN